MKVCKVLVKMDEGKKKISMAKLKQTDEEREACHSGLVVYCILLWHAIFCMLVMQLHAPMSQYIWEFTIATFLMLHTPLDMFEF